LPVWVVPHDWPEVLRAHPVVSVSVVLLEPHMPARQTASVRVRVRLPDSLQVLA
jgi:hypothetical protein